MKERPIIFSGEMVKAIQDGRKTQTRRVVKAPKWSEPSKAGVDFPCPHGAPGNRLWVREAWRAYSWDWQEGWMDIRYRADNTLSNPISCTNNEWLREFDLVHKASDEVANRWRPSIHMPRWASRITLELTDVRVERRQDISEEDAAAEGYPYGLSNQDAADCATAMALRPDRWPTPKRTAFARLWQKINGKPRKDGVDISWAENPWVWVLVFRMVNP